MKDPKSLKDCTTGGSIKTVPLDSVPWQELSLLKKQRTGQLKLRTGLATIPTIPLLFVGVAGGLTFPRIDQFEHPSDRWR